MNSKLNTPKSNKVWGTSTTESRYRAADLIGRGENGSVYIGIDSQLNRPVAIKRLEKADHEQVQGELDAMCRLNHPNIGQVFDRGVDSEGNFLVMEYLEGQNLSQTIQNQGLLEASEIGALANQLLDALVSIHEAELLHLDLKPANIMVSAWEKSGHYTLIDFGNSRPIPTTPRNRMEKVLPTSKSALPYASPEQLMEGDIDVRSDLYSLGILLYEAATGRKPYMGNSPYQVLSAQQNHPHIALSEIRKDLPKSFCDWVESLFATDPSERPTSAIEALESLKSL